MGAQASSRPHRTSHLLHSHRKGREMAAKSEELVNQLLDAEKKAEDIIATAKKNRLAMLKVAKDKAQDEVKVYEDEKQEHFKKQCDANAVRDPADAFKESTEREVAAVNKDYEANKARTLKYVIE